MTSAPLTELGATRLVFEAHHQLDASRNGRSDFLPRLPGGQDLYTEVSYVGERVKALSRHFDAGTVDENAARNAARHELPKDARLVFEVRHYLQGKEDDDQCDLIQYQSQALADAFPDDPQGVITVKLSRRSDAGFGTYDPKNVTVADVYAVGTLNDIPGEC